MAVQQDEDIRILELSTAPALQPGMFVAIDSAANGTQNYDLNNVCDLTPKTATYTESDISNGVLAVNGEHTLNTLTLSTISSLTINITGNYVNLAIDVVNTSNSNDVTITVKAGSTVLKYAKAGGNKVLKNAYFQLAALGNCWTLAEFI